MIPPWLWALALTGDERACRLVARLLDLDHRRYGL